MYIDLFSTSQKTQCLSVTIKSPSNSVQANIFSSVFRRDRCVQRTKIKFKDFQMLPQCDVYSRAV